MHAHESQAPGFQPQGGVTQANPLAPRPFEVTFPGQEVAAAPTNPFVQRSANAWATPPATPTPPPAAPEPEGETNAQDVQLDWRPQFNLFAEGQSPPSSPRRWDIQAKLTIGRPNDAYEQEADQVAAQVMTMPSPVQQLQRQSDLGAEETADIQTRPLAETITPLIQRRELPEDETPVQAKCEACEEETVQRSPQGVPQVQTNLEERLNASKGGGSPLSEDVRSFMEPRFGADFSQVRVHTGDAAVQMNQEVGAQAFTHGHDIYFGSGKSPGINDLTAHELTHTIQQADGVQRQLDGTQIQRAANPVQVESQTVNSTASQDVELIVNQIVNALEADPSDRSGRTKHLLARLNPSTRQAVLDQLQTRLTPQQQQNLQRILAEPVPDHSDASAQQMVGAEESTLAEQQQTSTDTSHASNSNSASQTTPDSSQTTSDNQQERKSQATPANTTQNRQGQTPDQVSSSSGKNQADIATGQAASQRVATPQDGNHQSTEQPNSAVPGSGKSASAATNRSAAQPGKSQGADQSASAVPGGEKSASAATSGSAVTNGSAPLDGKNGATPVTSSGVQAGSSSSGSQQSTQGVGTSGVTNQVGSANPQAALAQLTQNPEIQVPSAQSQHTQALLEQVAATANAARQRFTERITQGTEAIAASVQQQQAALIAAGEQQAGAIQALFATARAQVGEIINGAQAQLQTDAASHLAALQQGHVTTLGQVATTFSAGQERVHNLGNTYADRSLQTADESAKQVQTQIQGMAREAQTIGQEKAQVSGGTPEITQAKARAANEIASDTATKITSGVSNAMRDLRATGPETARGFREQGQEAARQVGAGQAEVVNQLTTANQQTTTGIQQTVTQGSQTLGSLGTQLTTQLASLEQTLQNQLHTQIAQKSQEIYQAGQQSITTFQQQGQQAIAAGDEHLTQFNQQLASMNIDPALAAEVSGEIVGQVNGAYDNLIATTDGAFQQADSALTQAGTTVITAISGISANASSQIQTFLGQARGQVTQQVGTTSGQLGTTVNQANATGSGMVSQVATNLQGQLGQIDSAFGQGLEQYRGGLNQQVISATDQAREPRQSVPNRIDEAQRRAEERAKNNWFVNQWNDFLEMVHSPGFWAGLITGLILGAIVVALVIGGVLTGGVAIVAAAALVGAIAAGVGTAVGNHYAGRPWHEGIVSNMIWGAFGGAVGAAALLFLGGVAAGAGLSAGATLALLTAGASVTAGIVTIIDNVAHGRPWDKGLLANMALAGILTWIGGKIEGFVRGRAPGGSTSPESEGGVRDGEGGVRDGDSEGGVRDGEGRVPTREERLQELARDPDHGGNVTPGSQREAEVALGLEDSGRLPGPVRRPQSGESGDFVDATGQEWDVKAPRSRERLIETIREQARQRGRTPPDIPADRPMRGEFTVEGELEVIRGEIQTGENVIIDTQNLTPQDAAALRQAVQDHGLAGRVIFYP